MSIINNHSISQLRTSTSSKTMSATLLTDSSSVSLSYSSDVSSFVTPPSSPRRAGESINNIKARHMAFKNKTSSYNVNEVNVSPFTTKLLTNNSKNINNNNNHFDDDENVRRAVLDSATRVLVF
eukprot:PhM_4_TR15889/c5_g1_i1/m.16899